MPCAAFGILLLVLQHDDDDDDDDDDRKLYESRIRCEAVKNLKRHWPFKMPYRTTVSSSSQRLFEHWENI